MNVTDGVLVVIKSVLKENVIILHIITLLNWPVVDTTKDAHYVGRNGIAVIVWILKSVLVLTLYGSQAVSTVVNIIYGEVKENVS